MTSPYSDADPSSRTYHVQIGGDQGIVIGDHAPVRFLAVLAGIIVFVAAAAQVLSLMVHDPWDHM